MLMAKLRVTAKKWPISALKIVKKNREFFFHCMAGMP